MGDVRITTVPRGKIYLSVSDDGKNGGSVGGMCAIPYFYSSLCYCFLCVCERKGV
jgi:hypothetical protein